MVAIHDVMVVEVGLVASLLTGAGIGLIEYFQVLPFPHTLGYFILKYILYSLIIIGVSKL